MPPWKPPKMGKASPSAKKAMKRAYARCRNKHPSENRATKRYCAMQGWREVKKGHERRNGKWVKKGRG